MAIPGAVGASIVDYTTGFPVATTGAAPNDDHEAAAAGTADVVQAAQSRSLFVSAVPHDLLEDLIITTAGGYHLLRLVPYRLRQPAGALRVAGPDPRQPRRGPAPHADPGRRTRSDLAVRSQGEALEDRCTRAPADAGRGRAADRAPWSSAASPAAPCYLVEGQVTYAESPAAPGVGELLTASGRLAARTWQAALDAGTSRAQVGRLLLEQGHLTQGELELCVLGATYDAAYFALSPASAPVDFLDGATHWLGPGGPRRPGGGHPRGPPPGPAAGRDLPAPGARHRGGHPGAAPAGRAGHAHRAAVGAAGHADGQRTPADLAQLLGRAGYATIQELRRLAALGLIERPAPASTRATTPISYGYRARGAPSVDVQRPPVAVTDSPTVPIIAGPRRPVLGRPAAQAARARPGHGERHRATDRRGWPGASRAPSCRRRSPRTPSRPIPAPTRSCSNASVPR